MMLVLPAPRKPVKIVTGTGGMLMLGEGRWWEKDESEEDAPGRHGHERPRRVRGARVRQTVICEIHWAGPYPYSAPRDGSSQLNLYSHLPGASNDAVGARVDARAHTHLPLARRLPQRAPRRLYAALHEDRQERRGGVSSGVVP